MAETRGDEGTRRIASVSTVTILKVVAVFLALYFLYIVRDIILLLLISVILSSALTPLVEWGYRRLKIPRAATVVVVYVLFISLVVLIFSLIIPRLIEEFSALGTNIDTLRGNLANQESTFRETFERYGLSNALASLGNYISQLTSGIFERTIGLFSGLFNFITVLVMSFYLVIQQDGLKDFIKSITPSHQHGRIANVVGQAQKRLGQWLLGQFALMFSIFLLSYIGLLLLGVKYALVLALFAGLLEIIPYIGPIISVIPAFFIALLQSVTLAIAVVILYIVIQQLENYALVPRILGRSIGANPLVVLIALLVGYNIAGIIGMLFAVPVVAIVSVVLEDLDVYQRLMGDQEDKPSA